MRAQTPSEGITQIEIQSGGGRVVVRASDGALAHARADAALGGAACGLTAAREGSVWRVKTHNTGAGVCDVALMLDVPKKASVKVTMVSGDLMMSGLAGPLEIDITEGNAVVGNSPQKITAHLGRGSLSAQGLRGPADLALERGNLQLFCHAQMTGTVALNVAHGQVSVVVPPRAITLDVSLGHGHISSNVTSVSDAPIRLTGSIDRGDLRVRSSS